MLALSVLFVYLHCFPSVVGTFVADLYVRAHVCVSAPYGVVFVLFEPTNGDVSTLQS